MREETKDFLALLGRTGLFSAAGTAVNNDEAVITVPSWREAVRVQDRKETEVLQLERSNDITTQIPYERFNHLWNDIVDEVKAGVAPLVEATVALLPLNERQRRSIRNGAVWDLLHAGMEHEYADVITAHFFRDAAVWYLKGHFVCGWESTGDGLRPIIY